MRLIDADALMRCIPAEEIVSRMVVASAKTIEPDCKWVPVTERLPEEKGEYLVTYHPCYWDMVRSETKVGIDTFRGKSSWAKKKHQRVIAWCEMPEPYKEEQDNAHHGGNDSHIRPY